MTRERFPELPPGTSDLLYAAMICLNRPRSRGRIWLTNTDPEQPPHVLLNLNTDPDDMRRMLSGVRKCWDIAHTGEFATLSQGVAILTQSGNLGINLSMNRRALPIAYMVSVGNQAAHFH